MLSNDIRVLEKNCDLKNRIRSIFNLMNTGTDEAVKILAKVLYDDSELLAHEAAYCLGQMKLKSAVEYLKKALSDRNLSVVVRHESAEALAAINDASSLEMLEKYANDEDIEVAETCQIARDRLKYFLEKDDSEVDNVFGSVDPAPPYPSKDAKVLADIYLNTKNSLFDRYRAMMALRNLENDSAANILAEGFADNSALFKHEIAFVLGQMRLVASIEALAKALRNSNEHPMVRHECAEALGNIADDRAVTILKDFVKDPQRIVRESCYVALDIADYQNSNDFNYC